MRPLIVAVLLLGASAAQADSDIARTHVRASRLVFKIDASTCRNAPTARTLTGFLLKGVGIVTAAHGIVGCTVNASPARPPFPARSDVKKAKLLFERDLAVLEPVAPGAAQADALAVYDPANSKNANRFMVCGFPTSYSAYMCFPVDILPGSAAKLAITIDAAADGTLKQRFIDRGSPDLGSPSYRVSPWENLGPGLSGAPIMDWYTGDVIAVVDGGLTLNDHRQVGWAIPLDANIGSDPAWVKYDKSPRDPRLAKLTFGSLPTELTSSDQATPPGARPMTAAERTALREIAMLFAQGLLETYPCQWMQVGVELMNTLCGAAPCTDAEIMLLYMKRPPELKSQIPQVCDAIRKRIRGFVPAAGAPVIGGTAPADPLFACDPAKADYWFSDYAPLSFLRILRPVGMGIAAQVALIYNILWIQVPESRRGEVLGRVLAEWEGADYSPHERYLQKAGQKFAALRQGCLPGGCDLGIAGLITEDGWNKLSRVLLERWFGYFNEPHFGFTTGCADTRIARGPSQRWEFTKGRLCGPHELSCYDFGNPRNTGIIAALTFADSIRIDQPPLELTISADAAQALVDHELGVSVLVKNGGVAQSGSFQIVLPLPSCAEYQSSDPPADFDPVTRAASWARDSLAAGALDAVKLTLKVTACAAPQSTLELAAVARTERDKRGSSNALTLMIRASPAR